MSTQTRWKKNIIILSDSSQSTSVVKYETGTSRFKKNCGCNTHRKSLEQRERGERRRCKRGFGGKSTRINATKRLGVDMCAGCEIFFLIWSIDKNPINLSGLRAGRDRRVSEPLWGEGITETILEFIRTKIQKYKLHGYVLLLSYGHEL